MRRVPSRELAGGIAVLEDGLSATRQNEVFAGEIATGILCSLGEEWRPMNVLLTGEEFPGGPASLPVLGGVQVARIDSPLDLMIWLDIDGVRDAHAFLGRVDFDECLERHGKKLSYYGDVSFLATDLRRRLGDMECFYGRALRPQVRLWSSGCMTDRPTTRLP